ncbi:hypothetical protein [Winogradskyella sediminis]|uniref:Uncharacterized protein n=1 Tax=Winogradskyella sediminis TaxID=1382466 RepID=A0A1H1X2P1_9FLAO|nr:hypothetical protein [Winogradskyella sediminis]SDT03588.1 hypothetical protein SAMN04489797_3079 [Winogradskyella sediminis]
MKKTEKNNWNVDFDNIFLIVPFFLFTIVGSLIKFTFLNLIALLSFNNYIKFNDLWKKENISEYLGNTTNFILGLIILIGIIVYF